MKTVLKTAEEKMEKSLDAVARDFASVRAGRANPSVLDRVSVDYYGCSYRFARTYHRRLLRLPDACEPDGVGIGIGGKGASDTAL